MDEVPAIRPTVRVLLVDESDRILLFRGEDPDKPTIRFWFPAGGGIENDETAVEAAKREVLEETGLSDFELGPHVWNRRHVFTFNGARLDVREKWFFARVPHFTVDISGFTDLEKQVLKEHRWWTLQELEQTEDVLTPLELANYLNDLMRNGLPKSPQNVDV